MKLEGIKKMSNRLSAIYKSVSPSRVQRTAIPSALAMLCVVIFVAGAVLVGHHQSVTTNDSVKKKSVDGTRSNLKPPAQASSQAQPTLEASVEPINQRPARSEVPGSNEKENPRVGEIPHPEESASAVVSESASRSAATTPQDDDSDANKTGASEGATNKRPVRLVVPEPPPVFSIMRTDEVRKKLSAATTPRTGTELSDQGDQEEREGARELKERSVKRMLGAFGALKGSAAVTGAQEPQIQGTSREELAAKGLDGI